MDSFFRSIHYGIYSILKRIVTNTEPADNALYLLAIAQGLNLITVYALIRISFQTTFLLGFEWTLALIALIILFYDYSIIDIKRPKSVYKHYYIYSTSYMVASVILFFWIGHIAKSK